MAYETITVDVDNHVALITLNRPDALNALNEALLGELAKALKSAQENDKVRCIVITGSEKAFAAGADISEFSGKDSDDVRPFFENNAWEAVWNLSKPTIAMVDGFALGGGTELALSCDIRIASDRSTFGQPEVNLGLIPGGGGTQRLCRLVGYGRAMEIVLAGGMIPAEDALQMGIVNRVVPAEELESATMELAGEIARKSPYTTKVAKRAVRGALDLPFSEGVLMERSEFVALFDTEDKEIGVQAFLERSEAKWVGR